MIPTPWRLLSKWVHPRGARGAISVLFFHRVLAEDDAALPDEPSAPRFARMLKWISSQYQVLPLELAVDLLKTGDLPPAAAAITFDDGYKDNFTQAAPLLLDAGLPATFFVSPAFLDGGIMWNDRVTEAVRRSPLTGVRFPELNLVYPQLGDQTHRGAIAGELLGAIKYLPNEQREHAVQQVVDQCQAQLPTDLMMTREEVRGLSEMGFGIGAHTNTHPILTQMTEQQAMEDIALGRSSLEAIIGAPVRLFAYPNGRRDVDFNASHKAIVREAGFTAAFTTDPGVCTGLSDLWELPRFTPWDRTELRFRLRLLANQLQPSSTGRNPLSASTLR